jgi:CrcB protein
MTAPVWMQAGAVATGGALGSLSRWGMWRLFVGLGWDAWPIATFIVNVIGCLCIGFAARVLPWGETSGSSDAWRVGLFFGVLGGFTTFSALGLETFEWVREGRYAGAAAILGGSIVFGMGAVALGWWLGRIVGS